MELTREGKWLLAGLRARMPEIDRKIGTMTTATIYEVGERQDMSKRATRRAVRDLQLAGHALYVRTRENKKFTGGKWLLAGWQMEDWMVDNAYLFHDFFWIERQD